MSTQLDGHDIQGSVVKAYSRWGFPKARYLFYRVTDAAAARKFISNLVPEITNSAPWTAATVPKWTTNIAFTYEGLKTLGVPDLSLHGFPDDFSMGMKARKDILGDNGVSGPSKWDPIWQTGNVGQPVHMMIWINGRADGPDLAQSALNNVEARYQELCKKVEEYGGVELMAGHAGDEGDQELYQDGSVIFQDGQMTDREHFGYADGISEPYFKGSGRRSAGVIGGGKRTAGDVRTEAGWEPLETGEFILGHKDEAFEYPEGPLPNLLARNGTYLVYRKLHQNVATFQNFLDEAGKVFPGGKEMLAAKFRTPDIPPARL